MPSKTFNSFTLLVIPSKTFSSEAFAVTPFNFETGKDPVIELAAKSKAIFADSKTKPPFAFKSTSNSLPVFVRPFPAVAPATPEN